MFSDVENNTLPNQFKLYTNPKKANNRITYSMSGLSMQEEQMKNTSATQDGKGGADKVNKKVKIINILKRGEVKIRPRIRTNWREENIVYRVPTVIKSRVELRPCRNITKIKAWLAKILLDITKNGMTIMCATDE